MKTRSRLGPRRGFGALGLITLVGSVAACLLYLSLWLPEAWAGVLQSINSDPTQFIPQ